LWRRRWRRQQAVARRVSLSSFRLVLARAGAARTAARAARSCLLLACRRAASASGHTLRGLLLTRRSASCRAAARRPAATSGVARAGSPASRRFEVQLDHLTRRERRRTAARTSSAPGPARASSFLLLGALTAARCAAGTPCAATRWATGTTGVAAATCAASTTCAALFIRWRRPRLVFFVRLLLYWHLPGPQHLDTGLERRASERAAYRATHARRGLARSRTRRFSLPLHLNRRTVTGLSHGDVRV